LNGMFRPMNGGILSIEVLLLMLMLIRCERKILLNDWLILTNKFSVVIGLCYYSYTILQ
jgi:hypothetical protein